MSVIRYTRALNPRDESPGHIYLLKDWGHDDIHKIGLARDVERRVKQIGYADLIHSFPADNMAQAESALHSLFAWTRVEGEWFRLYEPNIEYIQSITAYENGEFVISDEAGIWRGRAKCITTY